MDNAFLNHREAALALLNSNRAFNRKTGAFLGQCAVDSSPLSEAQADWLAGLLNRAKLPPLANGGAA